MFLKYSIALWMVLFSGSLFSQIRFEQRSSKPKFEWRLPGSDKEANELLIYNPWKLNLNYAIELKKNFRCSFLTLNNLAKAAESINDHNNEALECLNSLLVKNELEIKKAECDFEAITGQVNGSVRWQSGG